MSKSYKIKVNSGKGEAKFVDIPQAGTTGKPLTVKAVAGGKYQLVDDSSGFAPENIRAKRVGKDLQVFFEGRATADLVVEDYYDVTAEGFNALIGEAESGRFYEYIPESAVGNTAVPALADGSKQIGMALGGAEINPAGAAVGALVATGLFNPLLLGAGAVGAAAAASGGGSNSGTGTATDGTGGTGTGSATTIGKLDVSELSDSGATGDNITNVTNPVIVGKVDAGASSISVRFRDPTGKLSDTSTATVQPDGTFQVRPNKPLLDNSSDTKGTLYTPVITVTNATGSTTTDGTPFLVDTKAPNLSLKINADSNNDGAISHFENSGKTSESDLIVTAIFKSSEAKAGDEIRFQLGDGAFTSVKINDAMLATGQSSFTFANQIKNLNTLKVSAIYIDAANNNSNKATDESIVDLVIQANISTDSSEPKFTAEENLAFKKDGDIKWLFTKDGKSETFKENIKFSISDSTGNLLKNDTPLEIQQVKYSDINKENDISKIIKLDINDLKIIDGIGRIESTTTKGIESINISGQGSAILELDLLDVLNYGVNNILKLNLGDQPQFKIDGDGGEDGDKLNLTNIMNGPGKWTKIGTVDENYIHWSGFALGLEVDLLVHKNITVNMA